MIDADLAELLPDSALLLIDQIGLTETLILVEKYGGTAIWVPNKAVPEHPYCAEIGIRAWTALCREYASSYLEIPLCKKALRKLQDRAIAKESETLTDRELARKYRTTERTIRRIRARAGVTNQCDKTLDIFNDLINAA